MGAHHASRLGLYCSVATLWLIATPREARAAPGPELEAIEVKEGTLSDAELKWAREQLLRALGHFDARPEGRRLRLTIFVRGPRALDASLLVLAADGTVLGASRVRAAGAPTRTLLPSALWRVAEDAARTLGWARRGAR